MRPRLVFDLRYATATYPGIGSYAVGMLEALLARRPEWNWRILMPHDRNRFTLEFVPGPMRLIAPGPAPGIGQFRLGRLLRGLGAALYHSPYLLRPWGATCRTLLTLHDVLPLERPEDMPAHRRWAWRWLAADGLRADRVLTDSAASRAAIARAFGRESHVVLPAAPVREPGEPWPAWPRPIVLTVGINKPHKNLDTLIRAVAALPAAERPLLVTAGPTDPRHPTVAALAARAGIAGDVHALGLVPESRLAALYASATLVAFPTRGEGFGLPLLEAMQAGVPVVASDLPVLHEVAADAAHWCACDDVAGWTRALRELLADPARRDRLATLGRTRARGFTWERAAGQIVEHYRALVPELE